MADVVLHPAALREFQDATAWYQQRSVSAAAQFVAGVQGTLEAIGEQPERFSWYDNEFHEAVPNRYPSISNRLCPSI